jgi:hypothetical protein
MRTSFHHQPEAQHPKSPAIEMPAGRLPHLSRPNLLHKPAEICKKKMLLDPLRRLAFRFDDS